MFIIIFEYTWNMTIHTHSKYTFVNPNIYPTIPLKYRKYTFEYSEGYD